jgi:hypothetical protein
MNPTPKPQIILRIPLDRPPTEADHLAAVGMDSLEARLLEAGWVDAEGTVLKRFKISYSGHEEGEFYIEWIATLQE